jgi:hypothetical protein
MKASVAIAAGAAIGLEVVSNTTTGNHTLMGLENITGKDFIGIMAEPIAATDDDYATSGKLKAVRVPKTIYAKSYFAVAAGTFTSVDV